MDKKTIDPKLIGTNCIVDTEWYGKYKGILLGVWERNQAPELRLKVKIVECLRPPSTTPECFRYRNAPNPLNICVNRHEYQPGETQHFDAREVTSLLNE